ncbi:MAG: GIY-YIG nuclease family protein [Dehalococcoidales bacterium]|nr:GIY-YIG nuclease family protein [Dehalococcoidales bacterium]
MIGNPERGHGGIKTYCVYILASERNGTLYCGVTHDLIIRVYEHKNDLVDGFTKRYKVHKLVEKDIKRWYKRWKLELIEESNPSWDDLYEKLVN